MSPFVGLLAVAEESASMTAWEWDFPQSGGEWALYGGGFLIVFLISIFMYVRDTARLSGFWRFWLTSLRLGVLAGLVVIALNPQERTQKMSFRPSRVVLLVDTSLSMSDPESVPEAGTTSTDGEPVLSRAEAVQTVLADSPLIEELRQRHEVSLYTFDSRLEGPHQIFYPVPRSDGPSESEVTTAVQESSNSETGSAGIASDDFDWGEVLRPRGLETRLGESLLDIMRQVGGRTLSGIVVISDGGSNAGVEPSTANEVAKASNVRLMTVGVGSTQQPVNLQVASIQAPTDVHLGDPYEISAFVQGLGMSGRSVEVELLARSAGDDAEPVLLDSREVTLHEDGIPVELKFEQSPSVAGEVEFFVRAKPVTAVREFREDDNERRKAVNVIERKTRVLLLAGGPTRDYQFVRNMLYRHSSVTHDVLLQTVDPAQAGRVSQEAEEILLEFPETAADLFEYDVIIAFDPDWNLIPADRLALLREWVGQHAGGLILVAGDVHTGELASVTDDLQSIQELYPVYLSSSLTGLTFNSESEQAWPIDFTSDGREAGFLQLTDDPSTADNLWNDFSGFYRTYPTAGSKAGATVYAYFSDPRSQTEHGQPVLLATQFYGAGRTLYIGSPEIWRLRSLSDQYYDRFWTKAIREIGQGRLRRGATRGMLLLERNQYVLGQTVRVRAQLFDPQLEPLEADSVTMEVYDPNGRPLVPARRLEQDQNRPGQYVGDFRASLPGTYRIEVPIPESNDQLNEPIDVTLPSLEAETPQQNVRLLTDLTRDTGGTYLRLDEAEERLASLLPNQGEEFLVDERLRTLWDREWVLYLLVGFLGVEWITRKLLKLA